MNFKGDVEKQGINGIYIESLQLENTRNISLINF